MSVSIIEILASVLRQGLLLNHDTQVCGVREHHQDPGFCASPSSPAQLSYPGVLYHFQEYCPFPHTNSLYGCVVFVSIIDILASALRQGLLLNHHTQVYGVHEHD